MPNNLKAGEFYGQVPRKKLSACSVMTEVVHAVETSVPQHSHELAHFQLLLCGSYMETCGGKNISSRPMTISWHRPGMTHKDQIGRGGGRFFMIELQPRAISQLEEFSRLPSDFYVRNHALVALACRLYNEFKHWDIGSHLMAEGMTLEMLAHLARQSITKEHLPPRWLKKVIDKLDAEFLDNHSTNDLAALAGVHPVHLAAVFRRFRNETIGEYVQRLRIDHASRLLIDTKFPLTEIALSSGFSDQSHFTRLFKRRVGTTPGAFRISLGR